MNACGLLIGALLGFADPAANAAGTVTLHEVMEVDTQVKTRLHLLIQGKITLGKEKEQNLAGQALLEYPDRILEMDGNGLPRKIARYYHDARAKFVIGEHQDFRRLSTGLRLVIGERELHDLTLWPIGGPLTGDERELIEDILDTSCLPGLLPKDAVKVGASWKPEDVVIQGLCNIEYLVSSSVACTLESADAQKAVIKIVGTIHGFESGSEIQSKIEAKATVDIANAIMEKVVWNQSDSRSLSPIGPPGTYQVQIDITRERGESKFLADEVVKGDAAKPHPASKLLVFHGPDKQFRFFYDRSWHVTALRDDTAVLRRVEKGDMVAEMNVTLMGHRKAGTRMSAEEFQSIIEKIAGHKIEQVALMENLPTDGTFNLQAAHAKARNGQLLVMERHYLATSPTGLQTLYSFVFEPDNEALIGTGDLSLVSTTEFTTNTAAKEQAPKK